MEALIKFDVGIFCSIILILISNMLYKQLDGKSLAINYLSLAKQSILIQIILEILSITVLHTLNISLYIFAYLGYSLLLINGTFYYYCILMFVYEYIFKDKKMERKLHFGYLIPIFISVLFAFINLFSHTIFDITANFEYIRNDAFLIYVLLILFYIISALYYISIHRKNLLKREKIIFFIITLSPVSSIIVQSFLPGATIFWAFNCLCISAIYLFLNTRYKKTDILTGISTLEAFNNNLDNLENEQDINYTLVLIDIDNFKDINDVYGFYEGEFVLSKFASIIKNTINAGNIVSRVDGDEFYIYLENTNKEKIEEILLIIQNAIRNQNMISGKPYSVSYTAVYDTYDKIKYENHYQLYKYLNHLMYEKKQI